jgi:hypothetical protein
VKLSGVALRQERESEEKNAEVEKRAHESDGDFMLSVWVRENELSRKHVVDSVSFLRDKNHRASLA